ncbi:hypothetical protein [Bacillus sp. JCM 19034]|uniref:hypothetical protein n=1 Tax=Bacillus sp. JCM 19034 TaxID=1481928 RepID=UPI000B311705|nr:hypothetical protein [Bacillus sp. JCM 19034]
MTTGKGQNRQICEDKGIKSVMKRILLIPTTVVNTISLLIGLGFLFGEDEEDKGL